MNKFGAKLFEVRDNATFLVAMAMLTVSDDVNEAYLLGMRGMGKKSHFNILLYSPAHNRIEYNPEVWQCRTMTTAHQFISEHWDELESGDVIDVRVILGETDEPCGRQRLQ